MMPRVKTIDELRKELAVREKAVSSLAVRRQKALARLAAIDRAIAQATGGKAPAVAKAVKAGKVRAKRVKRAKRGRAKGGNTLASVIQGVLGKSDQPMRVKEIVNAAMEAGYKSSSRDFYGIVAAALRDAEKFKKAGRGLYKLA
jgi:hypothetical protein